jgi:hypothetical protein
LAASTAVSSVPSFTLTVLVLGLSQNLYTLHPLRVFVFSVAANRDSWVDLDPDFDWISKGLVR